MSGQSYATVHSLWYDLFFSVLFQIISNFNSQKRFGWVTVTKKYDGVSFPIFSFIKDGVPQNDFNLVCELLICGIESDALCQNDIICDKNEAREALPDKFNKNGFL